ncbi:MAG: ABC transporter ATP-binding protein [Saprospiraceae bacterium]
MYTPLQRFFRMLYPNKKEITHLYLFAITHGLIALSLPLGIQAIINLIQGGEISASWVVLVSIVMIGFIITGALQIVQMKITEDLEKDIFARSAFEFAFRIPKIKMEAMDKHYAPELMNRFFDTMSIQKGVSKILLEFTTAGLQILFGLIVLSFYHSFFIIFSFLVIFVAFIIGNYIFRRGVRSSIIESKFKYKVAFWLEELARTFATFKLESKSPIPLRNTDEMVSSYLDARDSHFKILLRQYYLFVVFKIVVAAGFLILGGILVFNQQMNIGQFVAAEIIVLMIVQSSEKMLMTLQDIYDLLTSIEKIGQVTDMELEHISDTKENVVLDNLGFSLSVENLSFTYPNENNPVFSGLSFFIGSHEKVGLTGPSGSGKITLVKLLLGFFKASSGKICFNGLPIDNYDIGLLRDEISVCYHENNIFDASILENITLGLPYENDRLRIVLEVTNLLPHLSQLKDGYNTFIGPHGLRLSGTVWQKILLARCLLKNVRFYIIEDILKNIPTEEKTEIMEGVLSFLKDATMILITKDSDILKRTDRTIVLNSDM